jgi:SAM-dependent methyltransferase
MKPNPLADVQWQSRAECEALAAMWATDAAKLEAEAMIGEMVAGLGDTHTIIDLGCGNGRLVDRLPAFRRYHGYDTSPHFVDMAIETHHINKRCAFEVRDIFGPWGHRTPVDVLICVHVARHYDYPLEVLRRAVEWPAKAYVLSALHGPEHVALLNGVCLSTDELNYFMATTRGFSMVASVEQGDAGGMQVRYWSMRRTE